MVDDACAERISENVDGSSDSVTAIKKQRAFEFIQYWSELLECLLHMMIKFDAFVAVFCLQHPIDGHNHGNILSWKTNRCENQQHRYEAGRWNRGGADRRGRGCQRHRNDLPGTEVNACE